MSRFHKNVLDTLRKAGWYPNRKTNVYEKVDTFLQMGFFINQPMIDFLMEFDELCLTYSNGNQLFEFQSFYPDESKSAHYHHINGLMGQNALEVGCFYNSELAIIITEDCNMFCYDFNLDIYKIGDYYDEGIAFICTHGLSPNRYLDNKMVSIGSRGLKTRHYRYDKKKYR